MKTYYFTVTYQERNVEYYKVEADSLEEARRDVEEGMVDPYHSDVEGSDRIKVTPTDEDGKEIIPEHHCDNYFEASNTDIEHDQVIQTGYCTECGREMAVFFKYVETIDNNTGETLNEANK